MKSGIFNLDEPGLSDEERHRANDRMDVFILDRRVEDVPWGKLFRGVLFIVLVVMMLKALDATRAEVVGLETATNPTDAIRHGFYATWLLWAVIAVFPGAFRACFKD